MLYAKKHKFSRWPSFFKMAAIYNVIYIVTPIFDSTRTINAPKLTRILISVNFIFLNHENYKFYSKWRKFKQWSPF